ncbi:MAG: hypothetical protein APF83_04800 [Lutibacter sp. BRH_c52]|nr:MAG: hypothetical protein APF83_04800 [Lutibacter sp. BRH_c52]
MNNWTKDEEQAFMNFIEADDSDTIAESIEHAHYMMYNEAEGNYPELKQRTLKACISRFYKICERRQKK